MTRISDFRFFDPISLHEQAALLEITAFDTRSGHVKSLTYE